MNAQERFLRIAHFEKKPDVFLPSYGTGGWSSTIKRWYKEGLPEDIQIGDERSKIEDFGEDFYDGFYLCRDMSS